MPWAHAPWNIMQEGRDAEDETAGHCVHGGIAEHFGSSPVAQKSAVMQEVVMHRTHANELIAEFTAHPGRLPDYIRAVENLLENRLAVLRLIPACPVHGEDCAAHAKEWIREQ